MSTEMIDSGTTTVLLLSHVESAGSPSVCLTVLRRKYMSPRTSVGDQAMSPTPCLAILNKVLFLFAFSSLKDLSSFRVWIKTFLSIWMRLRRYHSET